MYRPAILFPDFLLAVLLFFAAAETLSAQDGNSALPVATAVPTPQEPRQVTAASVEAGLADLEANTNIEAAIKDLLRPKYKQAIDDLRAAEKNQALASEYLASIQTGPEKTRQLRDQLKAIPLVENPDPPSVGKAEELQAQLDARKSALTLLNEQLTRATNDLIAVKKRVGTTGPRKMQAEKELLETRAQLTTLGAAADSDSPGRRADRISVQSREARLAGEVEMLAQEQASQLDRENLLQAQIDLLSRQVENATSEYKALEQIVLHKAGEEASRSARDTFGDLPRGDSEVQGIADEYDALIVERQRLVDDRKSVSAAGDLISSRLDLLKKEDAEIRARLDLGGAEEVMSELLLDMESQLLDPNGYAIELPDSLPTLDQSRLAELRMDRKIREHRNLQKQLIERGSPAVSRLLESRLELLTNLRNQYGNLTNSLSTIQKNHNELAAIAASLRDYLSKELFWLRTVAPLSAESFNGLPASLNWAFGREEWQAFARRIVSTSRQAPVRFAGLILLIGGLLLGRPRMLRALEETGVPIRRISTDRYRFTWQALLWTVLLALPLPMVFAFLAWCEAETATSSDWRRGLTFGFISAAWITFDLTLLSEALRSGGLGESHFRWKNVPRRKIQRAILAFAVIYIPAILLVSTTLLGTETQHAAGLGRLVFITAQFWTFAVVWRLLFSGSGVWEALGRTHPDVRTRASRKVLYLVLLGCPLLLIALSWNGYLVMAIKLSVGIVFSFATIGGGVLLYWMALRWFFIKMRRLALSEALRKRQARLDAAQSADAEESDEIVTVDAEGFEVRDLGEISEQTRHMIWMLASVLVGVLIVLFWSGMFPLISSLDGVPFLFGYKLLDAAKVLLIGVVSFIVIKDLPGLLELSLLRGTSIEPGTRYAIVRICQYVLIAIALALLLPVLKVDWTQFGWIAAALSVGLGFGLQEVVANFVCGLILLFERPIRVGDIVTLENVTGTVTRIQLRSTTITNWDRQDFVVPNKNLITGTILNWTLSASIHRINIVVGVAYGTDTEAARQILLEVATDHPQVLAEPSPFATFEEFATSSLTMVLRCFIPDLDNRLKTISELHTEIDRRFKSAGIEIAFPQLDLHLRGNGHAWPQTFPSPAEVD